VRAPKRVWHLQRTTGRCDHGTFDHVLELTHVPRPRAVSERVDDGVGNLLDALALALGEASDEVCHQHWNVVRALA